MNLARILATTLVVAGAAGLTTATSAKFEVKPKKGKRMTLFNGRNFDGLYTYIREHGKNSDPEHTFTIEDGGIIHAAGKEYGYVSTQAEYENYRCSVEFKWGEKKYYPKPDTPRDAGLLYHCVGEDKVWMKSLEFQIQEKDCGDMWLTGGAGGAPSLTVKAKNGIFDPTGEERVFTGGRIIKGADYEKPNGQWNKCEVVAKGDTIQHWINGHLNMEGTHASLTKGKLNLQSEGAEIYYRNFTLEPLE